MIVDYNKEDLSEIILDFYNVTAVNLMILDSGFNILKYKKSIVSNDYCRKIQETPEGRRACSSSDIKLLRRCGESKKPERHICHAGLTDIAVPIIHEGIIIGYVIMGQIKTGKGFCTNPKLQEYYDSLEMVEDAKIRSITTVAVMLAKYILLENIMKPKSDKNIEKATMYINENIFKPLSATKVAQATYISKSSLYRLFHSYYHCTVSEYINFRKTEKAENLLANTDYSIEEISEMLGYSAAAYFSRIFKKIKGVSPIKFRQTAKSDFLIKN